MTGESSLKILPELEKKKAVSAGSKHYLSHYYLLFVVTSIQLLNCKCKENYKEIMDNVTGLRRALLLLLALALLKVLEFLVTAPSLDSLASAPSSYVTSPRVLIIL